MQRVLIVEDEAAIAESVAYALRRDGFAVDLAASCAEATLALPGAELVILDLMLPDGSGFDLIGRWRRAGARQPVIVLSSRDGEADRVAALETGADDYVTKPFSPREVVARVRAVLRRAGSLPPAVVPASHHALTVDEATRRARVAGQPLELTKVEFELLAALLETPGRVYTRSQLIDRVWGDGFAIGDRTIDSHVKALRRKIGDAGGDASLVETVRGVGYRAAEPGAAAPPGEREP
ncbi:MAG: response regulator transcription factor [Polyangiaceae bacterium]|nr:response regulator transcription factor [Polyangiaceae bacterium]